MMLNATFNNISVVSRRSVILVDETAVPGEYHRPFANHWQTASYNHIILYRVHLGWVGLELTTLVVIGTACIGSCRSNYHTITTPSSFRDFVSFSFAIQERYTILYSQISFGGNMSARHDSPDLDLLSMVYSMLFMCISFSLSLPLKPFSLYFIWSTHW